MTLHQKIEEALSNNLNGWCSKQKADDLASLVVAMGGGNVVEIGVYTGRSFIPMAMAVAHCGCGTAYGIDPFKVEAAVQGEDEAHVDWWKRVPFERIEEIFREKLAESGALDVCRILVGSSNDVNPPPDVTLLHVDGNHKEQCLRDVTRYACNVVLGGFCVLDDVGWHGGAVNDSIEILKHLGFVERRRVIGDEEGTTYKDDYGIWQRTHYCA